MSDVPPDETVGGSAGEPAHAAHLAEPAARRAIGRERDAAEASRDRFAYLAEASRSLASSLDYETTLVTAAGLALPYLGAWCIVDVCTDDGQGIRRVAVLHPDPAKQAVARALAHAAPRLSAARAASRAKTRPSGLTGPVGRCPVARGRAARRTPDHRGR